MFGSFPLVFDKCRKALITMTAPISGVGKRVRGVPGNRIGALPKTKRGGWLNTTSQVRSSLLGRVVFTQKVHLAQYTE